MESSIVKCSHCRKMFSERDFEVHKCGELPLKECRIIEVAEIYDGSYEGKKLVNGWGLDGILYTFELAPRKAISIMESLSRRKVTDPRWEDKTDEEGTEPPFIRLLYMVVGSWIIQALLEGHDKL